MNESSEVSKPVPLAAIRPGDEGRSATFPDLVVVTGKQRTVLADLVHWRRSESVPLSELVEFAVYKCERAELTRAEAQALMLFVGLGDLSVIERARARAYRAPST